MIGIYKIINIKSNKIYLGSSIDIEKRFKRHKNDLLKNKHTNIHLQREYNKYGLNKFKFVVIQICNEVELREVEQSYLDEIFEIENFNNMYYNIGLKSCGGDNLTNNPNRDIIINKIRKGLIDRYKNETEEERKYRIENITGENNPNYGNKWNKKQKSRMSKQRKGNKSPIKGKTYEDIHGLTKAKKIKQNISEKMKGYLIGKKNGFYGKKHSEKNIRFFSESQKNKPTKGILSRFKPFYIDNKTYFTLSQASKKLEINYLTIRYRLNSDKFVNYIYIDDIDIINKLKEDYINQSSI